VPVAIKMTEMFEEKKCVDNLKCVPLTHNTASKRIRDVSEDMLEQLLESILKGPKFAILLTN
jgi:hypothetical protein